jgi:hypothetical protein
LIEGDPGTELTYIFQKDGSKWELYREIESSGSGGSGHIIQDEGVPLPQRDTINFIGSGVTVTDEGGKTVVNIGDGGSGTNNYDDLSNKPKIAGVALSGDKPLADFGIASTQYVDDAIDDLQATIETEISDAVTGLYDDRGDYDASSNLFPSTGGSGAAGAILKGDIWTISVAGTLGGIAVVQNQTVRAKVNNPGTTASNWTISKGGASTADQISITPAGNIAATNVQAAVYELDSEKANIFLSNLSNIQTARQNLGLDYESANVGFVSTINWDFVQSGIQKTLDTIDITATGDFILNLVNSGITGIAKITKNTANAVIITLGGSGLTHRDAEITITALSLPAGAVGDEYFLTFYKFGSNIYWVTRDGAIVQTLSASTSDLPSVGLLNSELTLRHKQGGNAFGANAILGTTDAFDLLFYRANAERAAILAAGLRITGAGTTNGQNFLVRNSSSTQVAMFQDNGLCMFGTGTPVSTLDVNGSQGAGINTTPKTANYTATSADFTIVVDATSGALVITLPAASGCTRRLYIIKKIDASANTVTIDANASETIDGALTKVLSAQWEKIMIQSNGTGWYVIG